MKTRNFTVLALCMTLCLAIAEGKDLELGFLNPPVGSGVQTWWHWANSQITRQGIQRDIEGMQQAGYEVAHIFVPSMTTPAPVNTELEPTDWPQMLEDGWRDIFRFTCEQAAKNGLILGVHNCPGWSSSGGPWITPEYSMQVLTTSETPITVQDDNTGISIKLAQPKAKLDWYRDVAIFALPDKNSPLKPKVSATGFKDGADFANLLDNDPETCAIMIQDKASTVSSLTLEYPEPIQGKYLKFLPIGVDQIAHLCTDVKVEYSLDGTTFNECAKFSYRNYNDSQDNKYLKLGDGNITAKYYRVTFTQPDIWPWPWFSNFNYELQEIAIVSNTMIQDVGAKNSATCNYQYNPDNDRTTIGISKSEIIDLTDKVSEDGQLNCELPPGNWIVLRIGHTTTGKNNAPATDRSKGLECDKLSKRGLDAHWNVCMKTMLEDAAPYGCLKYATIDSYEVGGQNWTEEFAEEFMARRGYDLKPYLPVIAGFVIGSPNESCKFLYDFQHTVADLFAENYYDYFTQLCHANGLFSILEAYGGPFGHLRCMRSADIPCDEFWLASEPPSKRACSAVNVMGRHSAGAESFTTEAAEGRWLADPNILRKAGDRAMSNGISQIVVHSYVHQPYANVKPGHSLERHGSMLNRNVTWWPMCKSWTDYLHRSQYLMQTGTAVSQLLILCGEANPNNFNLDNDTKTSGFDYDFCCAEDIVELLDVTDDGKILAPSGAQYEVLHLGFDKYLSCRTLNAVLALAKRGATIAGVRPIDTPTLSDTSDDFNQLCNELWGNSAESDIRPIEKGRMITAALPAHALKIAQITPPILHDAHIKHLHRICNDTEIFWFLNDQDAPNNAELKFANVNCVPEIWDAYHVTWDQAPCWDMKDGMLQMTLPLNPHESKFVILRKPLANGNIAAFKEITYHEDGMEEQSSDERKFKILMATYRGNNEQSVDVTEQIRKLETPHGLKFPVSAAFLGCDGDFTDGQNELTVKYQEDGNLRVAKFTDGQTCVIRNMANRNLPSMQIMNATWSSKDGDLNFDVTAAVRDLLTPTGLNFTATSQNLNCQVDDEDAEMSLNLTYDYRGRIRKLAIPQNGKCVVITAQEEQIQPAIVINSAKFRVTGENDGMDVTKNVSALVTASGLDFLVNCANLQCADPAPGKFKELEITYELNGMKFSETIAEHTTCYISADSNVYSPLTITLAVLREPNSNIGIDVTQNVQKLVTKDGLDFKVNCQTLNCHDPAPGKFKEIEISYELYGTPNSIIVKEYEVCKIELEEQYTETAQTEILPIIPMAYNDKLAIRFTRQGTAECKLNDGTTRSVTSEDFPEDIDLNNDWTLSFPENSGAPASIHLDQLMSWTDSDIFGVKYFSGIAIYEKTFEIEAGRFSNSRRQILDLGNLANVARVSVNDQLIGIVWQAPYTLDITSALKVGTNTLKIEVANLWANRMIGDAMQPKAPETICPGWPDWVLKDQPNSGTGIYTWSIWQKGWTKDDEPLKSGIFGPAKITTNVIMRIR